MKTPDVINAGYGSSKKEKFIVLNMLLNKYQIGTK